MHPILFQLGWVAVPTQGVLAAIGLLAGLALSSSLGVRFDLQSDRIWNLGLSSFLVFFLGERLLVVSCNLRDFLAHPFWMLGLASVRDERYAYGGALLAGCAAAGYIGAWRMPWRRTFDALGPGACVALALSKLGSFAAGVDFGRPASAPWGLVYRRGTALAMGIPLGVPLLPTALYAALLYLVAGLLALRAVHRVSQPGEAAALALFLGGLGTVLLAQLRYRLPEEPLLFAALTPAQAVGAAAVVAAGLLWFHAPDGSKPQR